MNNYCTLFNKFYLLRGLTMYRSMKESREEFTLYVLAMDEYSQRILQQYNAPEIQIISMEEFESKRMLKIKKTRTAQEYCWTCASFFILYILEHKSVTEVTYLDADIFFFKNPDILLKEFRKSGMSVMITPHRYSPQYDQSLTSGLYCVQFMTFRASEEGKKVIYWWTDRCEEWCFNRVEDGKFGDQKYLDDWTERFDCIYVLNNPIGGVAPWNVQQYLCESGPKIDGRDIVFYHFHHLVWCTMHEFDVSTYRLTEQVRINIYLPYLQALQQTLEIVNNEIDQDFTEGISGVPAKLQKYIYGTEEEKAQSKCKFDNYMYV